MSANDLRPSTPKDCDDEVTIRLTVNEAVVLLGLTQRYSETDRLTVEDQAEQRALWNLSCLLERADKHSSPSFEQARAELRDLVED